MPDHSSGDFAAPNRALLSYPARRSCRSLPGAFAGHFLDRASPSAHCRAVTRTPFDQLGKDMVSSALQRHGRIKTEREVAPNSRRIDVWFTPRSRRSVLPDHLGLLGQILRRPCALEFCHKTPNGAKLSGYVIKHGDFRHLLLLDKKRNPLP